jgi:2-methylisocitrate lyase-like PEP mutase family enzyme
MHHQVSATLLGEPDLGLLTPPEMARKAGQIVYSIPGIPVLVDADTGEFCQPHVRHTRGQVHLINTG